MSETYGDGRFRCVCTTLNDEDHFEIWDLERNKKMYIPVTAWREMVESHAAYFEGRSSEDTHWGPIKKYAVDA